MSRFLSRLASTALACTLVLSLPVWSEAQSLTTVYQVRIYLDGGAAPITTYDIAVADVRRGQPKVPAPGAVVNPSVLRWDDELNPTGHDCTWTDSGTGPLFALPISLSGKASPRRRRTHNRWSMSLSSANMSISPNRTNR